MKENNKGINIKNFVESLETAHELEFSYNGNVYVIQPIKENGKHYLVAYLWKGLENCGCIAQAESLREHGLEKEVIDKVLNTKCFEGKSFFEIYEDIEIINWL